MDPKIHLGKLSTFFPQKRNPNRHTERGLSLLESAMSSVGYVAPMTATADGEVIDGSARLEKSALVFPDKDPLIVDHDGSRPVIMRRTDIPNANDPRAVEVSYGANRVAEVNLNLDPEMLKEDFFQFDLHPLWTQEEVNAKLLEIRNGNGTGQFEDVEPQIDKAEELRAKWHVELGQLWQLGEHKLLCGDSTKREDVERVMGGEKAIMGITSPPYNQSLTSFSNPTGMHKNNKWFRRLDNAYTDNMPEEKYQEWQCELLDLSFDFICSGGAFFYNHKYRYRNRHPIIPLDWIRKTRWELRQEIIWNRGGGVAANAGMFIPSDERIYWMEKDGTHVWNGVGNNRTTVWAIPPKENEGTHVCPFPLELIHPPITCVSNVSDIIFEPFSGSGTTIIACEQLGRKCRAMEISPAYVAVTLERYYQATKKQPQLL